MTKKDISEILEGKAYKIRVIFEECEQLLKSNKIDSDEMPASIHWHLERLCEDLHCISEYLLESED